MKWFHMNDNLASSYRQYVCTYVAVRLLYSLRNLHVRSTAPRLSLLANVVNSRWFLGDEVGSVSNC